MDISIGLHIDFVGDINETLLSKQLKNALEKE